MRLFSPKSDEYKVGYICSNCGGKFQKSFPKGKEAHSTVRCSHCGCLAGVRDWNFAAKKARIRQELEKRGKWSGE